MSNPCFFIFGFGYTAHFLAQQLSQLGFRVIGTTRNKDKLNQCSLANIELIDFSNAYQYLSAATHILVSAPPTAEIGDPILSDYTELLKQHAEQIQWLGYLSSTGVYGDHQGAWVDESSPAMTLSHHSEIRLKAEQQWMSFAKMFLLPLHVFRLAGIYGPQRNALERILKGKTHSVFKPEHYFSRIHVEDIVSVIRASFNLPNPYSIYNVADNEPTPPHIVDAYASKLLKLKPLPLLPYEQAHMPTREREFYNSSRRVANTKIQQELGVKLNYPTYREGLEQLLSTLNRTWL